jgi:hypothetical protein
MGFTAMEKAGKLMMAIFLFSIQDFWNEVKDWGSHIFLVNHIETS